MNSRFFFGCFALSWQSLAPEADQLLQLRPARIALRFHSTGSGMSRTASPQTEMPKSYTHKAPVPGLAHSAVPVFPDVDQYQSRELLSNLLRQGRYSAADFAKLGDARGISRQQRNYFWYRKTSTFPAQNAVALLKINKAQFGSVVYLNGVQIGEHAPCFTAAYFDVTRAIHWGRPNELVIRIGAHPRGSAGKRLGGNGLREKSLNLRESTRAPM